MSDERRLRIGLLMDSFDVPAWVYEMLEQIRRLGDVDIALVVLDADPPRPARRNRLARIAAGRNFLLHVAYGKWDRRRFRRSGRPDATEPKDAAGLLSGVAVLKVEPRRGKFSDRFDDADVDAIRQYDLDVLVRLGFRILRGEILRAARCGVWSFHHADNRTIRGSPSGLWEVLLAQPVSGTILQILNEDLDNGTVLSRSYYATDLSSPHANLNALLWKGLHLLPRELGRLGRMGQEAFLQRAARHNRNLGFYCNRLYSRPTNRELLGPLCRHLARRLEHKLRSTVQSERWRLAYRFGDGLSTSFWRFRRITPPKDRFWADPHVIFKDGTYYIFIEEYVYAAGKAHISVIEMDNLGNHGPPHSVLDAPHHLSYPFVFEHAGDYYMVPESVARPGIDVYKCTRFPDRWEPHGTLLGELRGADPTLFFHAGRWWLFTGFATGKGRPAWDELSLFHAKDPLSGDWTPHAENPVVCDVRCARPAGGIFELGGRIYRPAQDCSRDYGRAVRINEILTLTPDRYAEREVSRIEPNWDRSVAGVHQISRAGRLTVIDCKVARFRIS